MRVLIIGNGIAGVSAAHAIRKKAANAAITILSGESLEHWSRPALMYVYMGHMRLQDTQPYPIQHWSQQRIERIQAWAERVDTAAKRVHLRDGSSLKYDKLLLATGSQANRFGWPGEELDRVQGLVSLQDLARLEALTPSIQRGAIVGGGLIGVELAEMLRSRGKEVLFLVRERNFWNNELPDAEAKLVNRQIRAAGVDLRLETELVSIEGEQGQAVAVHDAAGQRTEVQFVGLTAGVRPNTDLARASGIPCEQGILTDSCLRTQVPDVWAAGDCAEIATVDGSLVQSVWYTGRAQGEAAGRSICGNEDPYSPGIWFNSAKFFNLEYQAYGEVPSATRPDPSAESLYWEQPGGQHAIRIVHRGGAVVGFNLMGIRFRQAVCEAWIREGAPVEQVLRELDRANFSPEFSRRHYRKIRGQFRAASS
jgi:3-phenylpropionate/trans-cinnamate dioxygenase ferredoxin reductase component